MAESYLGEIRMFGGNFAPLGWAFCDGSLLPIDQYDALFSLISTTYGGDGQTTFGLPDLRGRIPLHMGSNYRIGQAAGEEDVTLTVQQLPVHTHALTATANNASSANAAGNVLAQTPSYTPYISGMPANTALRNNAVTNNGGGQPHSNLQPYLCVTFIISLEGIYPPRQ